MNSMDMYGGLSPEDLQSLLATNADPAKLQDLQDQRAYADKLRSETQNTPHGAMIGNVYVPDFAGSLANLGIAHVAKKKDAMTDVSQQKIYDNQAKQSLNIVNALRNLSHPNQQPAMSNPTDTENT